MTLDLYLLPWLTSCQTGRLAFSRCLFSERGHKGTHFLYHLRARQVRAFAQRSCVAEKRWQARTVSGDLAMCGSRRSFKMYTNIQYHYSRQVSKSKGAAKKGLLFVVEGKVNHGGHEERLVI